MTAQQVSLTEFATRTLPYDLEDACIELVSERYLQAGRDHSVLGEDLLSHKIKYADAVGALTVGAFTFSPRVVSTLNKYRCFV